MCLADEDVPQRGRSRGKVEAAREEEALCSGHSLLFDHSRCYEGWCVSGRGFPSRLKGFLSAELINRWHHKSRCSEESHDDLWIRCCETHSATEAAVAMFTLSTASSEASAEQDIFRHGCEGDLRQDFTVVQRGGHHRSTASPFDGSFWRLAVLEVHTLQGDFSKTVANVLWQSTWRKLPFKGLRRRTK